VCSDDYRGPSSFSEPETRAVRNFLANWPNIKFAVNFHAYDNTLVHPFNFDANSSFLENNFPDAAAFYQDLIAKGGAPSNTQRNATLTNYRVNGDASDYMLGEHGIWAISPFIGSTNVYTKTWFIHSASVLCDMLASNREWLYYYISRALPLLEFSLLEASRDTDKWNFVLSAVNSGWTDVSSAAITFVFNSEIFENFELTLNSEPVTPSCDRDSCTYVLNSPKGSYQSLGVSLSQISGTENTAQENLNIQFD